MTLSIIHPFIHFLLFTDWGINVPPSGSNRRPLMSCPWQDHGKKVYNLKLSTAFATRCLHWRWLSRSEPSLRRRDLSFTAEDPRTDRSRSFPPPPSKLQPGTLNVPIISHLQYKDKQGTFSLSLALSAGLLDPASLDVQLLSRKAVEWERTQERLADMWQMKREREKEREREKKGGRKTNNGLSFWAAAKRCP